MQNIYKSKFVSINILPKKELLIIEWLSDSEDMTEEEFKNEIQAEIVAIKEYKPTNILARTTQMSFVITPNMQEWHNELVFPVFKNIGVSKLAIILSSDIFSQISIEQLIEDNTEAEFITHYFDKEDKALLWLQE
ncbi:hypothetical protein [Bernardetia sp.]|uniref:hypothetical protein n=1 Tax=Bernardetia sp. TaxID=1937974 RepID=UPI0025BB3F61|nr:hypothetical protein [Bernardetia sp.]